MITRLIHGVAALFFLFNITLELRGFCDTRPSALSREMAAQRSRQISRISYTLWFGLDPNRSQFEGRTIIRFELRQKAKDVGKKMLIDLEEGDIHSIILNGTPIQNLNDPERYDGHHIYFQLSELLPTSNRIEIAYSHPYSTSGNGIHRFKDPVDGQVYLYTHFEPYNAHRLFPCFDQPDLKATYELTAEVPKDWVVISNTLERETTNVDGRKSWAFPTSLQFSTYLFALHAGPYSVWKSDADGIPIRLFSRKSVAQHVDAKEWFQITRKGLEFFGTQFGYPYPFTKYDQILVPDFNAGAMENVGAVTFSEKFIFRTRVTQDRHRSRADTILHEMAHMWFGDLVTMRWWNGLWLNESFASFMSHWAVDQATDFSGSWQAFFSGMKQWAYWEDQLVTTHPIELPVQDTDQAESNFDGITYGKGASVLKQLRFYIGEDEFIEGLQRYFQKFSFKNTNTSDFIKMLSEASNKDLSQWQHSWLHTAGLNTLKVNWECETDAETQKSKISKFDLLQSSPTGTSQNSSPNEGNDLRIHKTEIALLQFPKGKNKNNIPLKVDQTFAVTYSAASTPVKEAIGKPCPVLVFPNYHDQDYVKVELDATSLKETAQHLDKISDAWIRQMLWHTLWEMVIDGNIRAQDYAEIVLQKISKEKDTQVLSKVLKTLVDPNAGRNTVLKILPPSQRNELLSQIEILTRKQLLAAPGGSDLQLVWYQAYLDSAQSPQSLKFIHNILEGKQKLKGFKLDHDHKWELIQSLARNGFAQATELIQEQLEDDPSDMGQKAAIAAEAAIPTKINKNLWLERITRNSYSLLEPAPLPSLSPSPVPSQVAPFPKSTPLPLAKMREAMWNFNLVGQEELIQAAADIYFKYLPTLALSKKIEDEEYAIWFTKAMFPALCDSAIIQKTTTILETYPNLPAPIMKRLKIGRQEEERCVKARERSLSAKTSSGGL